jgi:glycerol uptake facilitator-like aquaporin
MVDWGESAALAQRIWALASILPKETTSFLAADTARSSVFECSGGLFNPAVSWGLALVGAITPIRAVVLTVAQILGGITGAAMYVSLCPHSSRDSSPHPWPHLALFSPC